MKTLCEFEEKHPSDLRGGGSEHSEKHDTLHGMIEDTPRTQTLRDMIEDTLREQDTLRDVHVSEDTL